MKKSLTFFVALLIIFVLAIKFVPQFNDLARTFFPPQILELLGEKPKSLLEQSIDATKANIKEMGEKAADLIK